jgi:hypothetical protein
MIFTPAADEIRKQKADKALHTMKAKIILAATILFLDFQYLQRHHQKKEKPFSLQDVRPVTM